jgi:hypothetical protein
MLASDMDRAKMEARHGEKLVCAGPFQDVEVNGKKVELEVHEGGDDDAASLSKGVGSNVRIGVDERVGVHAPLQEKPSVQANDGDGEEDD